MRVSDADLAWRVFSTLAQLGSVLYVQQFLPNFGYDIRVLKIGQRWLSVKRRSPVGQWRTNVSLGSQAEPHELTDHERQLAELAAQATGGSFLELICCQLAMAEQLCWKLTQCLAGGAQPELSKWILLIWSSSI